jgi:hypothetical protein
MGEVTADVCAFGGAMRNRLLAVSISLDSSRVGLARFSLELLAPIERMQCDLAVMRLQLAERTAELSPTDSAAVTEHVHVLTASLGNLRRMMRRCEAGANHGGTMAALSNIDTRRHSCECLCVYCERNGTGYFAQRAALDGDESAAERLSAAVYAALAAERASRRAAKCNRCPHE